MYQRKLIQLVSFLIVAVPLAAQATPLNIKAGAWEDTTTVTTTGAQHMIPPEVLKSMPPDRRERLMNPPTMTLKATHCVKDSDTLENAFKQQDLKMKCDLKNVKKSASSYELDVSCSKQGPDGKMLSFSSHVKVKADSAESVVSTADMQASTGTKSHTETRSHWLKASCEGVTAHPYKPH